MAAEKMESMVLDHIRNIYRHPKVQESISYDGKGIEGKERETELSLLEKEISQESTKMLRQHDAYERGIISLEEYEENLARIRQRTEQNRMERDRLVSTSSVTAQQTASIKKLVSLLRDFDTAWKKMELSEQKAILRSLIRQIRAGNGRVEIDFYASSY
jgi:hypothetical protein